MPKQTTKKSKSKTPKSLFRHTTPLDIWRSNKVVLSVAILAVAVGVGIYGYMQRSDSFASSAWAQTSIGSIPSIDILSAEGVAYGMTAKSCVKKIEVNGRYQLNTTVTTASPRVIDQFQEYRPFVASGPIEEVQDLKARYEAKRGVNAQIQKGYDWVGLSTDDPSSPGTDSFVNRITINSLKTTYPVAAVGGSTSPGGTSDPYVVFGYTKHLGPIGWLVAQSTPVKLSSITSCDVVTTAPAAPKPSGKVDGKQL